MTKQFDKHLKRLEQLVNLYELNTTDLRDALREVIGALREVDKYIEIQKEVGRQGEYYK